MSKILHITNGDCAVSLLKNACIEGGFLPWRDVLHEGPVPKGLSLFELSQVRARHIADRGWGNFDSVNADFVQRDTTVLEAHTYDEVVLWFEHDLYDQLQLVQVLSVLSDQNSLAEQQEMAIDGIDISGKRTVYSLIQTDDYLSSLSEPRAVQLFHSRKSVEPQQFALACKAWEAFRNDSPEDLVQFCKGSDVSLPHLANAVWRLLQEYPCRKRGLSRTEHSVLKILAGRPLGWKDAFSEYQKTEEARFLGDLQFRDVVTRLSEGDNALLYEDGRTSRFSVTESGMQVLAGRECREVNGLDRWIGGVHLHSANIWLWDDAAGVLLKQNNPG